MTLPTCTPWEVEEFIEQMLLRPGLWFGKNKLWVRKVEGQNAFAVKFVNSLPDNMYAVHVKHLGHVEYTQETAEEYTCSLLERFTSYGERKKIEDYLTASIDPNAGEWSFSKDIAVLAREIAQLGLAGVNEPTFNLEPITRDRRVSPMEGVYGLRNSRSDNRGPDGPDPIHPLHSDKHRSTPREDPPTAEKPPEVRRSRYLQNLLKGKG